MFTIDDFEVSTGLFAIGSVSFIVLVLGITFACVSCIAYRKRKALASTIRRVSNYAARVSTKIRRSIARSDQHQEEEEPDNNNQVEVVQ